MKIQTHPLYDIDEYGIVRLISTNSVIPEYRNHRGLRAVKIRGKSHKPSSQPIARLMLSAFKPLDINKNSEWLSVKYQNENQDDIRIDNLDWDETWYHPPPQYGESVISGRWIPVFGYPELELRLVQNTIIFRESLDHREIGVRSNKQNDYLYVKIPKVQKYVDVHQLVALTLLPHPRDTYQLVVNHRDSNKKNNHPRNLEWATYKENNFHAYKEGLRSLTVRKIRLKNIESGEEVLVAGYQEMARYLNALPQGVHQAMTRRVNEGLPYKGHLFKYEDDKRTWDDLIRCGGFKKKDLPDEIACKNMRSGDVIVYDSLGQMKRDLGIRAFMVRRLLNERAMIPWRGFCIQPNSTSAELKWPQYPEHILQVYAKTSVSDKPIRVTNQDNSESYYTGVTEWCMEDRKNRCDPAVLSRYMVKANGSPFQWRSWVFEYIDLNKYPMV